MTIEGPHKTPTSQDPAYQNRFQTKLLEVLYTPLTVDTIDTFADTALAKLVTLTQEVTTSYKEEHPDDHLEGKDLEDAASAFYQLDNVRDLLDRINEKQEQVRAISNFAYRYISSDSIITPPDQASAISTGSGSGMQELALVPRLTTLLYILETDFEISTGGLRVIVGRVSTDMMRKLPYVRIEIDQLHRVAYICDEEGNASYVFDLARLEQESVDLEKLDDMTKEEKNALIAAHPGIGRRMIQTADWRSRISTLLREPISSSPETGKNSDTGPVSEFERRRTGRSEENFLPFDEFAREVPSAYQGETDVTGWYRKEFRKHTRWPSDPNVRYKGQGWVSFRDLVKESRFLSFDDFVREVWTVYPGGDVGIFYWYKKECQKHPRWPLHPEVAYKNQGWPGWSGLSMREEKKLLSFDDFVSEVASAYPGEGGIFGWYRQEYPKHKGWPATPERQYKDRGWTSWTVLAEQAKNRQRSQLK